MLRAMAVIPVSDFRHGLDFIYDARGGRCGRGGWGWRGPLLRLGLYDSVMKTLGTTYSSTVQLMFTLSPWQKLCLVLGARIL